jgi:hypothetical protein
LHADLGRHAGHQQVRDAVRVQQALQRRCPEGALARLHDDRLVRPGGQLGDEIVARLAVGEDAPHRPRSADAQRGIAADG